APTKNRRSPEGGRRSWAISAGALEEPLELPASDWVLELSDGLGLDLADAFSRHLEDPAHLFEGVGVAVAQAVAKLDDLPLAARQRFQDLLDLLLGHFLRRGFYRAPGRLVIDEVAEVAVLTPADGPVERDRVAGDLHHPPRLLDRDIGGAGGFLDGRLAALLLEQLLRDVAQFRHRLDHVHRDADRAGLVGDRAGDRLADPPGGVGAERVASAVRVLVARPHEARVPLLDQVEEREAAIAVLLGDRDHQPEVAAGKLALGLLVLAEPRVHRLDPDAEALRGLERDPHQV